MRLWASLGGSQATEESLGRVPERASSLEVFGDESGRGFSGCQRGSRRVSRDPGGVLVGRPGPFEMEMFHQF